MALADASAAALLFLREEVRVGAVDRRHSIRARNDVRGPSAAMYGVAGSDREFAMQRLLVRLGLLFPTPAEEQAFVASAVLGTVRRTRFAMLVGCCVYYLFSVWDRLIDPEASGTTHLIRAAVVLFALLPLTALTFWQRAKASLDLVLLAYCAIPAAALALIYRILAGGYVHGAAGMIIIILFVATLLPMRVAFFAAFAAVTWASFALQETWAAGATSGASIVNNLYIGTALILALYAVAMRERQTRQQFRAAAALVKAQRRTETALAELQAAKTSLIQAEKLAALGQLVAGVAHEVNTPIGIALTTSTTLEGEVARLAASIGTGRILRSELEHGLARLTEGCKLLFSNLDRAADLIGSFKQVAVDQVGGERRTFAIGRSLQELLRSLGPLLRQHGHAVALECPDDLVIDGYPGLVAQVVSNLIVNAITHAYPAGRKGHITLRVGRHNPGTVRLVVADDGIGIAPDHIEKVFEPFYTTNRRQGSSGLGLHIVHNIVVGTLQGELALESRPGQGTRFTIDLPLQARGGPQRRPSALVDALEPGRAKPG